MEGDLNMKEIFSRRSIRKYEEKPVSEDMVHKLLRAAMYAPSAGNERPWHFIVVKDKKKLNEISENHLYAKMLPEAALAIIPCCDISNLKYEGSFWIQDMAASIQNILLEAKHLGLGSCWCGVYPREFLLEPVKRILNTPENIIPVAIIAIGYPGEEREVRERYKEDRVHYEKW